MRKTLFVIVFAALIVAGLWAHPANKVTATFNAETSILTVNFEHKVNNTADHFVYSILIQLNGKKAVEQIISVQETAEGGTFVYKMPGLKKGDKINVVTDCNKGGKRSATITIP